MAAAQATKGRYWTAEDDAQLMALRRQKNPRLKTHEIAAILGRTTRAIYERNRAIAIRGQR